MLRAAGLNVYDLLRYHHLVLTKAALERIKGAGGGMRREYTVVEARSSRRRAPTSTRSAIRSFQVRPDANKIEIKRAVEKLFKVKVVKVRTANVLGDATGWPVLEPSRIGRRRT
jgi:ribosomal protein L23